MLDLGWQEFFLIAIIAVVVVGPKDLPRVIRTVTQWVRKIRTMARDFQGSIEEVAREAELDDIRRETQKLANQDFSKSILDTVDPDGDLKKSLEETRSAVESKDVDTADESSLATLTKDYDGSTDTETPAVVGGESAPLIKPPPLSKAKPKPAASDAIDVVADEPPAKKPRATRKPKPKVKAEPGAQETVAAKPTKAPRRKATGGAKPKPTGTSSRRTTARSPAPTKES